MTALIVIAVIAAVIAAILLIPIKIYADFHGRLRLWVKVLFLRFDIIPKKESGAETPPDKPPEKPKEEAPPKEEKSEEKPKEEKPKNEKPESEKPKEQKPPEKSSPEGTAAEAEVEEAEETGGFIDRFLHYYSMAREFLDPFRRALRRLLKIDVLNVDVRVGTKDAAATAVYTGMLWGVAGNLLGLVSRFVTVKKPLVNIAPAYNETVLTAEGSCIIRTNPANIIGAAAIAALAYLKYKCKNRRNKK